MIVFFFKPIVVMVIWLNIFLCQLLPMYLQILFLLIIYFYSLLSRTTELDINCFIKNFNFVYYPFLISYMLQLFHLTHISHSLYWSDSFTWRLLSLKLSSNHHYILLIYTKVFCRKYSVYIRKRVRLLLFS